MTTMDPHSATLAVLVTAAQLAILVFLYRDNRERFFGWVIAAWSLRAGYFIVQLFPVLLGAPQIWSALAAVVSVANAVALLLSAVAYRRPRALSEGHAALAAGTALAAAVLVSLGHPARLGIYLAAVETTVLAGAALGFCPSGRPRVRGTGVLSATLLAWAAARLGFRLPLPLEVRVALVTAATFLQVLQMIAVIVVVLDAAKHRVEFLKSFNDKLIDGMDLGLALVARDLTVTHVNRWMTDRMGVDLVGRTCVATYVGSGRQCAECPWRDDAPGSRQFAAEGPAGRKLWITCSPLTMPDGSRVLLELLSDVTEHEAMRSRLLDSERLATIGRMAARVAHEIRNPLGVMGLHTDLAADELDSNGNVRKAVGYLAVVKQEIRGVAQLIETYLRFGRIPPLEVEPVDIDALVDGTVKPFEAELGLRRIAVRRTSSGSLPSTSADPEQLGQVVVNLVRNAIEAMPTGGALSIRTAARHDHIELEVADTGAGVRPEDAERIFRPFETTKRHGTGLGLAVAREIAQAHGGTLECRPAEGGARFVMTLPILGTARPE